MSGPHTGHSQAYRHCRRQLHHQRYYHLWACDHNWTQRCPHTRETGTQWSFAPPRCHPIALALSPPRLGNILASAFELRADQAKPSYRMLSVERYADKLQARKRLSASSAGSTASVSVSPITRADFVAHRGVPSQPESSPAKWHDVRQRSKRSPVCNRRPRDSDAPPGNTTFATPACPSNGMPISCRRASACQLHRLVRRQQLGPLLLTFPNPRLPKLHSCRYFARQDPDLHRRSRLPQLLALRSELQPASVVRRTVCR